MCEQLTILAKSSDYRYIGLCEHGTIHLFWHHSTLYLSVEEFERFVQFVSRGINAGRARRCEGRYHLALTANRYYQLWIGNAGLLLSAVDWLIFVDLGQVALRQLQRQPTAGLPLRPDHRPLEPTVMASLNSLFSTN